MMYTGMGLLIVLFLVGASIFVNGWTDSPNAIATVISTRVLAPRTAVVLGAVFNFIGVCVMGTAVAATTASLVTVGTGTAALVTLGAAQLSIVIWSVTAWRYGIPTSESHALIAGLMGAGISYSGLGALNWSSIAKVAYGLLLSPVVGIILGFLAARLIESVCRNVSRRKTENFFSVGQVISASLMAFSHGAQDGQKFMGVFYLALAIGGVYTMPGGSIMEIPIWIMILCSVIMAIGTSVGGYKIIKSMGIDMVKLEKYQGFAAEIVASASMIAATMTGIPLSTTNIKATAMMGAGASKGISSVNWGIAKDMVVAWVLTFPICMVLGYVFATLFRFLFSVI